MELLAVALLAVLAAVVVGGQVLHASARGWALGALVGILAGALGAVVILTPRLDLFPDELEGVAGPALLLGVTAVLALGTIYRATRR
jgi:prepilin signal peptidase PulO-like enzyme (type II secretory pathway)